MSSFDQLNLNSSLLQTLDKIGHKNATPIQLKAIPQILAGKDVVATAQTGTGKTAAYLLPAFEMLINKPRTKKFPRILVLTPTRELAFQVKDAAMNYGRHLRPEIASILGGMPYNAQLKQLAKPLDIIVATPGRLIDHLEQKRLNLSAIEMLVIDEADRMLDMGFIDDVKLIASSLPKSRQTLLFTATLDKQVANLANSILNNPERIEVVGKQITIESIEQRLHIADDMSHKNKLLQHILANECVQKAIIFTATKRDTDILAKQLRAEGHQVGTLHGDMRQNQRNKTIMHLRSGKIYVLVATDVAARGIDINDISHVINYDLPKVAEDYVHRIGRTGRAGRSGIAISFANAKDGHLLKQIEKFTQQTIKQHQIPGLEAKQGLSNGAKPKQRSRSRSSNKNHSSEKRFSSGKRHSSDKPRHSSDKRNYSSDKRHASDNQYYSSDKRHSSDKQHRSSDKRNYSSDKRHASDKQHYSSDKRPSSDKRRSSDKQNYSSDKRHASDKRHSSDKQHRSSDKRHASDKQHYSSDKRSSSDKRRSSDKDHSFKNKNARHATNNHESTDKESFNKKTFTKKSEKFAKSPHPQRSATRSNNPGKKNTEKFNAEFKKKRKKS